MNSQWILWIPDEYCEFPLPVSADNHYRNRLALGLVRWSIAAFQLKLSDRVPAQFGSNELTSAGAVIFEVSYFCAIWIPLPFLDSADHRSDHRSLALSPICVSILWSAVLGQSVGKLIRESVRESVREAVSQFAIQFVSKPLSNRNDAKFVLFVTTSLQSLEFLYGILPGHRCWP